MADDKVSVEISIEERAALKALTALTKGVDKFEKQTVDSVKKTDKAFDSFKGNLAAIATSGAVSAIAGSFKELVIGSFEAAAATEKLTTQFEVLTGNTEIASNLFQQLTDFSASTPFQLNNIAEASSQLLSFGFSADSVRDRIEKIGEVAAGSNSDLKEVALIYGQVAAAGKLTGERLLQLQERAIPIGSALANSLGVAESEVKDLVSSGVVGFKEFEQAFNSMSEAGGLFEGAIEKQSKTVNGALSTLSDNFSILQTTIGNTFKSEVVEGAQLLTQALQEINQSVKDNEDSFKSVAAFAKDYVVTYVNLAGSALKAKTPIDDVNESIENNVNAFQELSARKKELESRKGSFLFGIFDKVDAAELNKINEQLKVNKSELDGLINKRKELNKTKFDQEDAEAAAKAAEIEAQKSNQKIQAEQTTNLKILEERRKLQDQLLLLEQDAQIKAAERELAQQEITQERREVLLNDVADYEAEKIEIAYQAELEKNRKIRDAETKALADRAASAKKEIALKQNQAKVEQTIQQTRVQNEQKMVQGFGVAFAQAASIAKKGTAEQKLFATAAATINTYAAATRAFRDYPYPANIAVLATTIATGLKQVQEINKVSFATGGVVGGMAGASMGNDNTTANVRTGEMILNANQQRRLFDIATGEETTPRQPQMIEVTSIVQVDEREIARAVRNQRLEGFAI